MSDSKRVMGNHLSMLNTKELLIPDTVFVRDIENRVFQGIVLQCLSTIQGISLLEGNFMDSIFSRGVLEGVKGIQSEQDSKSHCINIKIEVDINYGIPIPEKAEEIQTRITDEITHLTGLHVASVHVIFKNVILPAPLKKGNSPAKAPAAEAPVLAEEEINGEYNQRWD
jgi:uncharacterized alkaline shock family protein YloU